MKIEDRLTKRIGDHVYYTKGKYSETLPAECESWDVREILKRLAAYEDTGLSPDEVAAIDEKQIPKEPTAIDRCPNCGSSMNYYFRHCPDCGQRIGWKD